MKNFLIMAALLAILVAILPSYMVPVIVSSVENDIFDIPECIKTIFGINNKCPFNVPKSDKVVLVVIDAFGWNTWKHSRSISEKVNITQYTDMLADKGITYKIRTTYPSTTRVAFSAMLPDEFFYSLDSANISYSCIGSEGFFNTTEICPKRIIATNLDGDRYIGDDDDKVLIAIEEIKNNATMIFIHLSVDSTCHKYGPYSDESMDDLQRTDSLLGDIYKAMLENSFYSKAVLIVSADHGCHPTVNGGEHGSKRHEDMEIPLIIYQIP